MARLGDITKLIRSKNAGPFMLTIDIMFVDRDSFELVKSSEAFSIGQISRLFNIHDTDLIVQFVESAMAIKISFPRQISSGGPGDTDVFGCQQYALLVDLEV